MWIQPMGTSKRVAVIGAGLSGLTTMKELLEAGHEVECFEQGSDIGGVFSNLGSYDSVVLTVSNYFMSYSDFMPYDEPIRFWTRSEYRDYLHRYAKHFNLKSHITFQQGLEKIDENADGSWRLHFKCTNGEHVQRDFDRVAVCCGQFQKANIPDIPGLDSFTGEVMHSSDYKNIDAHKQFHDKRVLCFGMGESAADIVAEINTVSRGTTLSVRRFHIFSSRMVGDRTIDTVQSRFWHSIPAQTKAEAVRNHWRQILRTTNDPAIRLLAEHNIHATDEPGSVATKTERIFHAMANGMKLDIGGVKRIEGSTVYFENGHSEDFDAIMMCTGFNTEFPFLPKQYRFNSVRECFLQCYHPILQDRMVFIGFARPQQGGVPLISEMLARYYALVLSGERQLPGNLKGLAQGEAQRWDQEFYDTPHVAGLVNGFRFNETVADLIGCRPPRPSLFLSPRQFAVYWFHHIHPNQYRLVGPGAREEAIERWTNTPFSHSDGNKYHRGQKIKMIARLILFRLRSLFTLDDKRRWRPIFRPLSDAEKPIPKTS